MHYGLPIGHKKTKSAKEVSATYAYRLIITFSFKVESSEEDPLTKKRSNHLQRKIESRKAEAKIDSHLDEQFVTGRIYGKKKKYHNVLLLVTLMFQLVLHQDLVKVAGVMVTYWKGKS